MGPDRASRSPRKRSRADGGALFWNELYWFTVLSITSAALGLWILPAKAARHRGLLELEGDLKAKNTLLKRQERVLEGALHAVEHDEFYKQAVWRKVLGVKKNSEEFLERDPGDGR